MVYTVGIITASDKGYLGQREDVSGRKIKDIVTLNGYQISDYIIVPDEEDELVKAMLSMCDEKQIDLILTTGGTGFSQRDCTPEATLKVITKQVYGIPEAIRAYSMTITKRAMLSRAVAGIRNHTLIVNLPGSPKAVEESLTYIIEELSHGLAILAGEANECARKE